MVFIVFHGRKANLRELCVDSNCLISSISCVKTGSGRNVLLGCVPRKGMTTFRSFHYSTSWWPSATYYASLGLHFPIYRQQYLPQSAPTLATFVIHSKNYPLLILS